MPDQTLSNTELGEGLALLAQIMRDGAEGYRTAGADTKDPDLRRQFEEIAQRRLGEADELDQVARRFGGEGSKPGQGAAGALHRMFMDLRAAISRDDRRAMLEEVVRGENFAEAAFDRALRMTMQEDVRGVVQRMHDSVRETRNRFREMKSRLPSEPSMVAGFVDTVSQGGRRSVDAVQSYVAEQPMAGTGIALAVGFVIGLVTGMALAPSREHEIRLHR